MLKQNNTTGTKKSADKSLYATSKVQRPAPRLINCMATSMDGNDGMIIDEDILESLLDGEIKNPSPADVVNAISPTSVPEGASFAHISNWTQKSGFRLIHWADLVAAIREPVSGIDKSAAPCILSSNQTAGKTREVVDAYGQHGILFADIDHDCPSLEELKQKVIELLGDGVRFALYASVSNGLPNKGRRYRVVIPLARAVSYVQWRAHQTVLIEQLNADPSGAESTRLFNAPNAGDQYDHFIQDAEKMAFYDAFGALSSANEPMTAFESLSLAAFNKLAEQDKQLEAARIQREKERASKPVDPNCPIAWYNDNHDIEDVLEQAGYECCHGNRWRAPDSSSAPGCLVNDDDTMYSNHSNDPLADGHCHDAFDVFAQYQHDGDKKAARAAAKQMQLEAKKQALRSNVRRPHLSVVPIGPVEEEELESEAQPRRFHFTRISELKIHAPDFLVCKYVEQNTTMLLFGDPEARKTFLALDVGLSVAAGIPWAGNDTKKGPVVYVAGEGRSGIMRRVAAWCRHNDVDLKDLDFLISSRPSNFTDVIQREEFKIAMKYDVEEALGQQPKLVIIDTLARNLGGDENSNQDINALYSVVDELRAESEATYIIVCHPGHKDKDRPRGASALLGNSDAYSKVEINPENDNTVLTPLKMKDAEKPEPIAFSPKVIDITDLVDEEPGRSGASSSLVLRHNRLPGSAKTGKAAKEVRERREAREQKTELLKAMRKGITGDRALASELDTTPYKVKGLIADLNADGYVKTVPRKGSELTPKGTEYLDDLESPEEV